MKKLIALVLAVAVFIPSLAFAGSSTDAALGLGAFAVFNQILGGVGVFQRPYAVAAPVVVAPAPPVVVAPPPRVVHERVVVTPYYPGPVYYGPAPVVVYERPAFCPPGHARKGWCYNGRYPHRWHH